MRSIEWLMGFVIFEVEIATDKNTIKRQKSMSAAHSFHPSLCLCLSLFLYPSVSSIFPNFHSHPGYTHTSFMLCTRASSFSTVLTRLLQPRLIFSTSFYLHKQSTMLKLLTIACLSFSLNETLWIMNLMGNEKESVVNTHTRTHFYKYTGKKVHYEQRSQHWFWGCEIHSFKIQFLIIN